MATNTLFQIPERLNSKQSDKAILNKAKSTKKSSTTVRGGGGLANTIDLIVHKVDTALGKYRDEYQLIQSEELLHDYITECIGNGYISIDTETTGLDPMLDQLVGICIYSYGQKGSYIPLNHIGYLTRERINGQLPLDFVAREFKRLLDKRPNIDMFNATFDIRVLRHNQIPNIYCTWDGSIGARLINENEPSNKLKKLHQKYVLKGKEDEYAFDELFNGIKFNLIPLQTAYLYAAHDPIVTTELCDFQRPYLTYDSTCDMTARNGMNGVAWVFHNIEMPCVEVVADMEDIGIRFDADYNAQLVDKYHALLDEREAEFHAVCDKYADKIQKYRNAHITDCKLENPINIKSTDQLAILFYDILDYELFYDKKKKQNTRSTAEEQLTKLDTDVTKAVLSYREFSTIVSTFIDALPTFVNPNDGRIHCKFNQYGARTGRFSSQDPNLQNIPSHNKDIRKMFTASDGYLLMSSDYSQQEPSCLATFCKHMGYDALFNARFKGNDLYSEVASACFNQPYELCCEFDENGHKNPPEYKERRSQAKPVLLGILYGRGDASVAEQMNITLSEAEQLKANLFSRFPEIKKFEDESIAMAEDIGYVTTVCGRKRRLPEMQLDEFEFKWIDGKVHGFDPLDFEHEFDDSVSDEIKRKYLSRLTRAKFKDKPKIISQARQDGISIIDNGGKIAEATRQVVNSRIQGSAADLTKLAMIKLHKHERLKELGFRMLIPIHDEILAECPEENIKECSELLAKVMSDAAQEILHMPFSCDVEISKAWFGERIEL